MKNNISMNYPEFITTNKSTLIKLGVAAAIVIFAVILYLLAVVRQQTTSPFVSLPRDAALNPTPPPISATMSMEPGVVSIKRGADFTIDVIIDANNTVVNGFDSIINYDNSFLKVVSVTKDATLSPEFALLRRQTESKRVILTYAKTQYSQSLTQKVKVATIRIRGLKSGKTALSFEFAPGSTLGSTVIQAEGSQNILDRVSNTTITID